MKKKFQKEQTEIKKVKSMKETHYSIPSWKIQSLKTIGNKFKVKFNEPPFDNSDEEGYFDINELRGTSKWKAFLKEIETLKVHYEFSFKTGEGKKIYMPVQIWEKKESK
jgi:hypothetical protein